MSEVKNLSVNFTSDDVVQIKNQSRYIVRKFVSDLLESEIDQMDFSFQQMKANKYSVQAYLQDVENNDDREKLFYAGYVSAITDAMQIFLEKINTERKIDAIKTRYKEPILRILKDKGSLFHKDLAALLKVSPSQLNEIIRKMNATDVKLINVNQVSKYKIYSLTPVAIRYVEKRQNNQKQDNKHDVLFNVKIAYNQSAETDHYLTSFEKNWLVCPIELRYQKKVSTSKWIKDYQVIRGNEYEIGGYIK